MYVLMLFVPIGLVSKLSAACTYARSFLLTSSCAYVDTELIRADEISSNTFGEFIHKCPKTPMSVVVDAALQCIDDTDLAGM